MDTSNLPVEDEITVEGFRTSRRSTNWLYRGTAMSPSREMDVEDLQRHILDFEAIHAFVATTLAAIMIRTKQRGIVAINRVHKLISSLHLSLSWIHCYYQFCCLDLEDKITFVHRIRRFPPPAQRTIGEIPDDNVSFSTYGFVIDELQLLKRHLRLPQQFTTPDRRGFSFTGEEALLISLYHLRNGQPFTQLSEEKFGGDPRLYTYYVREFVNHVYNKFYHKLSGDSMRQWLPWIDSFREAIWNILLDGVVNVRLSDGTNIDYQVYIPFEGFRVFGWLDDTDLPTTRPRAGIITTDDQELRDVQRAFYNRYFRGHGLKAQVVHLPNGMIGSVYICSQRHNDNGVQNLSGLNDYLVQILQPLWHNQSVPIYPALYGDGIFATLATIIKPYQQPNEIQAIINTRFSSLREDIEHKFSQVFNIYKILRAQHRHQLFYNAEWIRKQFFVCLFLTNCHTCFSESRNRRYNTRAPTIQRHLPLDEELPAAAPELDTIARAPNQLIL